MMKDDPQENIMMSNSNPQARRYDARQYDRILRTDLMMPNSDPQNTSCCQTVILMTNLIMLINSDDDLGTDLMIPGIKLGGD